ncbi:hypothetical protein [Mobilicoccus pelagius]|uniref:Uncharacterized protein n=1 Tax=Mobilicoccus pelagius NBRC 104925 TaxID=1089455 RepID=H5UNC9_9MICO|nr:hypothetical protein [Mobilicoccus pelagius]GAB47237.1 hypothetical protein MOPEL_007_00530 [Mobilicoccus pelagius NBRC 104925]
MSQNDARDTADAANAPEETQVDATHTENADETTAGPAEAKDPGNDNPATNAPVE